VKIHLSPLVSFVFLAKAFSFAWQEPTRVPPIISVVESKQGLPGEPDVISHKHVSKGAHLKCIQLEHYPKRIDDGAACLLKFKPGNKYTLRQGESMEVPKDSDVYLECPGDKPTRCTVGIW